MFMSHNPLLSEMVEPNGKVPVDSSIGMHVVLFDYCRYVTIQLDEC